jgi:hypothetical protein
MPSCVPRMPWAHAVNHVSAVMQCDRDDAREKLRVSLRDNVISSFDALTDDPIPPAAWRGRGLIEIDEMKRRLLLRGLSDGPHEVELCRTDVLRLWPAAEENDAPADVPASPLGAAPETCGPALADATQEPPPPIPNAILKAYFLEIKEAAKGDAKKIPA